MSPGETRRTIGESHRPGESILAGQPAQSCRAFFGRVEALRGLCALAITAYHFTGYGFHSRALLPPTPWDGVGPAQNLVRAIGNAIIPAHAALMMLFVISGFVLRLSLEHGPQRVGAAAGRFLLGRAFRFYPIVAVAVLLLVASVGTQAYTAVQVVRNLFLLDVTMNGVLWALQVELLMAPVIVALYFVERRYGPRALLGLALLTTALAFSPHWAGWPPLSTNVFPFILGMVVPTLGRRWAERRSRSGWAVGAGAALLLTAPVFGLYSRFSAIMEAYSAFVLVSGIAYRSDLLLGGILDLRPLRVLGQASGSYYVLHMLTAPFAIATASALVPAAWVAAFPALVGPSVLVVWLAAIVPLAWLGYHLVEAPGIALGRRTIRWLRLDRRDVPPAPVRMAA